MGIIPLLQLSRRCSEIPGEEDQTGVQRKGWLGLFRVDVMGRKQQPLGGQRLLPPPTYLTRAVGVIFLTQRSDHVTPLPKCFADTNFSAPFTRLLTTWPEDPSGIISTTPAHAPFSPEAGFPRLHHSVHYHFHHTPPSSQATTVHLWPLLFGRPSLHSLFSGEIPYIL